MNAMHATISADGTLIAYDAWCAANATEGDSLSECVRAALRTDTATGKALFVGKLRCFLVGHPTKVRAKSTAWQCCFP